MCIRGVNFAFLRFPVPSQESEWSCICVLGVSILHFLRFPVPSQESEWLCICVFGEYIFYHFQLDFGTVSDSAVLLAFHFNVLIE